MKLKYLTDVPFLIYANKQDEEGAMNETDIIMELGLLNYRDHPWFIQSSCALSGAGLYEGLEWLARRIDLTE